MRVVFLDGVADVVHDFLLEFPLIEVGFLELRVEQLVSSHQEHLGSLEVQELLRHALEPSGPVLSGLGERSPPDEELLVDNGVLFLDNLARHRNAGGVSVVKHAQGHGVINSILQGWEFLGSLH